MAEDSVYYHYTSISSLNSIITSGKVWVSDCRYLNDRKELVGALDQFLDKVDKSKHPALSLAFDWHNFSRAHCVFSLSKSPKVLSQWRAYAEDGRGAAIGFNEKYLVGYGKNNAKTIVECVYKDHDQFLSGVAERYASEIDEIVEIYENDHAVNSFWSALSENPKSLESIYTELLRVKNSAFEEEQEVRLIISAPINEVETRVSDGLIIPYLEHQFVDDGDHDFKWCIAPEIWLGPKSDERNLQAIQCFQQFGWNSARGVHRYDCGYV